MVIETKELKHSSMNANTKQQPGPTRQLLSDMVELGELQLELLKADAREAGRSMLTSVVIGIFAACLILAAAPVLLSGIAHWMVQKTELTMAASLSIVSVTTAAVASVLGAAAYRLAKRSAKSLERSRSELQRNLTWLKNTLASDDKNETPRNAK